MNRLRHPHLMTRSLLAFVLALWLGLRLLTPEGFMPSFANGSLAIIECPDADGTPAQAAMPDMAGMEMPGMATSDAGHHDDKNGFHRLCPYAQAASLGGIEPGAIIVAVLLLLAALPPLARALPAYRRRTRRDRPPSHGPPLPA